MKKYDFNAIFGSVMKWLDNGRNQVLGRVIGMVTVVMQFAIYFTVNGEPIGIPEIIFWSIFFTVVLIGLGYVYSAKGFLTAEIVSRQHENPLLVELHRNSQIAVELLEKQQGEIDLIKKRVEREQWEWFILMKQIILLLIRGDW